MYQLKTHSKRVTMVVTAVAEGVSFSSAGRIFGSFLKIQALFWLFFFICDARINYPSRPNTAPEIEGLIVALFVIFVYSFRSTENSL